MWLIESSQFDRTERQRDNWETLPQAYRERNQELLPLGGIWFFHCIIFLLYCMFDYLYEKFPSLYDMIQFQLLYIYVCVSLIWLWIEVRDVSIQLLLKILDTPISIPALIRWFFMLLIDIKNTWFKKCP